MNTFLRLALFLRESQRGASAVEYAILIGLIAIVVIAGVLLLGPIIAQTFTDVSDTLDDNL
jgi:pilus assembly protein Flp/PilA